MSRVKMPRVVSLIYTQNPFYLISTCLFVYGLKLLFRSGDSAMLFQRNSVAYIEPWGLLASFAAVTLLMAVTATLVVRLGQVWEDARSLVLIVLLMLLAMAVSSDELLTLLSDRHRPRSSLAVTLAMGPLFAVSVCEFLIRVLRIAFDIRLRAPLYGFLGLFFLWPALLLPEATGFRNDVTRWLIVAFPSVAGLLTLTLIPVARRGAAGVVDNGTPWGWPLFPWTPFFFIGIAVCLRAYFLSMSFDVTSLQGHFWDTIFGVYQLIPFGLCVLTLLLEIARRENATGLLNTVLLTAPLVLVPACPWLVPWSYLPAYREFAQTVTLTIASPVCLAAYGLILFYGWATLQRVRYAAAGLSVMMILAGGLGPRAFTHYLWQWDFVPWPWMILALTQILLGLRTRQSFPLAVGLTLGILTCHNLNWALAEHSPYVRLLTYHALLATAMVLGALKRDSLAEALQELGVPGLCVTIVSSMVNLATHDFGIRLLAAYLVTMTLLSFGYGWFIKNKAYMWVAAANGTIAILAALVSLLRLANEVHLPPGVRHVIMAALSFVVAVIITVLKSGVSRRIRMWWVTRRRMARQLP